MKNCVGLFAGIGGFELGLKSAGYHARMLCEINPCARSVLAYRFIKSKIINDVCAIKSVGSADILTAGFPCQDLSSVGKKSGISGDQSSLIDEVFRILRRSDVEWVVLENVRFMLHLDRGNAMNHVLTGLENLGYRWAYRLVNSQAFGVPQRRHRIFFVASRRGDPRNVLLSDDIESDGVDLRPPSIRDHIGFYWTEGRYATGLAREAIPPLKAGSTIGIPSPPAILFPNGFVGTPHITDAERLQGFPPNWTEPAEAHFRPSLRWALLGNAVTVPVAKWIGKRINRPKRYRYENDLLINGKWPNAGWSMGEGRYGSAVSDWPTSHVGIAELRSFLRSPSKPLSKKALAGFLSRAESGGMEFPTGFIRKLESFADRL